MRVYVGLPLFVLLAGFQSVMAHWLAPYLDVLPNFVVLAAIAIGLFSGQRSGAAWGAFGGIMLDLASAGHLGAGTLALALVGFLSGFGRDMPFGIPQLVPPAAALLGLVVFDLVYMLLLHVSGWGFDWITVIYEVVLPSALINMAVMPVVFGGLSHLRISSQARPELGW